MVFFFFCTLLKITRPHRPQTTRTRKSRVVARLRRNKGRCELNSTAGDVRRKLCADGSDQSRRPRRATKRAGVSRTARGVPDEQTLLSAVHRVINIIYVSRDTVFRSVVRHSERSLVFRSSPSEPQTLCAATGTRRRRRRRRRELHLPGAFSGVARRAAAGG